MKKIAWVIAAAAILLGAFSAFQRKNAAPRYSSFGNTLEKININGNTFEVEVISAAEKVALGLSGRETLCPKCGMLFVFGSEDYRSFWMKDMKFDLDMIWIRGSEVVFVARNVSYKKGTGEVVAPEVRADKVLELNSGTSDRLGIKVGDQIEL